MKFDSEDISNDDLRAAYARIDPAGPAPTAPATPSGDDHGADSLTDALSAKQNHEVGSATEQHENSTAREGIDAPAPRDAAERDADRRHGLLQPPTPPVESPSRHAGAPAPTPPAVPSEESTRQINNTPAPTPNYGQQFAAGAHPERLTTHPGAEHSPPPPTRPTDVDAVPARHAIPTPQNGTPPVAPADSRTDVGLGQAPFPIRRGAPDDDYTPAAGPDAPGHFNPAGPSQAPRAAVPFPAEHSTGLGSQHPQPPTGWQAGHQGPPQRQLDSSYQRPQEDWGQRPPQGLAPAPDYTPQQPGARFSPAPRRGGDDLNPERGADRGFTLQNQRREGPQQGWRGALHRMHVPIGKSRSEIDYDLDIARINKVIRYPKVIGFASPKGGVGKTVCAMAVASTIAAPRHKGEVVAVDTDHAGSLARRVRGEQTSDLKAFVSDDRLTSVNDVKSHMQSNHHRLSVLGSSRSPLAKPLTPEEYTYALRCLQAGHLFTIVDMDTSAATPAYETIMASLDALVVVTATSLDSAEASRDMMDWIRARGMSELSTRTIVLMNHQSPAKPHLDLDATVSHFKNTENHEVRAIPWDEHLAEAGPINLDLLNKATRRQFVNVAALVVDSLPSS
ncbi:MAG: nucleotide-binding domain-containing protein [Mycobacterium sp.]|nr:nucleotide-binding domain-containing protein [Mycobacterium sp.]